MVRIVITLMMTLGSYVGFSQTSEKKELSSVSVTVNDLRSAEGTLYISIYESAEKFSSRTPTERKTIKLVKNSVVVSFDNLLNGEYVVGCFHDENDNQKMDFNEHGMPTENYGLSNNLTYYGPPTFDEAKFEVSDTNLTFEIKLF